MQNKAILILGLLCLMAMPSAVLTNVNYDRGDTRGWTGQQISRDGQWRPFLTPQQAMTVGTDVEAGQYDYFNATREKADPGAGRLDINLPHVCANQDIEFAVSYKGQPMGGVNVGLYSHTNGRALVGEVTTDANGRAVFERQKHGGYDLLADAPGYASGQAVFAIGDCQTGADLYKLQTGAAAGAGAAGGRASAGQQKEYGSGLVRILSPIDLPDGRAGTLVSVAFSAGTDMENWTLADAVPASLASGPQALGFESDYPTGIVPGPPLQLQWNLPPVMAGHPVVRSYVLLRPIHAAMMDAYGAPVILDAQGKAWTPAGASRNASLSAGGGNQTPGAGAKAAAGQDWPGASDLMTIGIGVLAIGALAALAILAWRRVNRKEKS